MKNKIIQDPVHGYIEVESMFIKIVDSIEFQRLKWIEQGSFRVLYPGARHDRFIHSLGTYFLAKKASKSFFQNIQEDISEKNRCNKYEEIKFKNTFLYAALLHDIGHAPFSHTCEDYFIIEEVNGKRKIDNDLINAIKSLPIDDEMKNVFEEGYNEIKPSPHEIISATMLVNKASEFLEENYNYIDIELAARMVIGLPYETLNKENGIKNCLIRLLNSNTVDVDKLDYICRDTKMMGFSNVTIDIDRMTKGVTAVLAENDDLLPAFRKNTLSVIDNVFRAKEEQGKWVISHPVVVYESQLIKQCIEEVAKKESRKENQYINKIFSYEALGKVGVEYNNNNYKLLSDIDIISDFKKYIDNDIIYEYFARNDRRKPIWKSYYEYVYIVKQLKSDIKMDKFYQYFSPLINYMVSNQYFVLNKKVYDEIQQNEDKKVKRAATLLKNICEEAHVELDLVLLEVENNFISKISKDDIYIKFENIPGLCTYNNIKGIKEEKPESNVFFYLYSKQPIDKKIIMDKVPYIMTTMRTR